MGKQGKVEWPSWRYGPDGAAQIFQAPEEVPEGWVDSMVKAAAKEWDAPVPVPEEKPKAKPRGRPARKLKPKDDVAAGARREALSALREAGVKVSDDATDKDLQKALDALE